MGQLSSTPQRETPIRLERRKSFSVGLWFQATDLGGNLHNVDLTGSTIEFIVAAPKRKGGAIVIDKDAVLTDPTVGLARIDLQAADLDLVAGEYPYSATLFDANGYSIVFLKGFVEVLDNTNPNEANVFVGDDPSTELHVELTHDNRVTVSLYKGMKGDKGDDGEDGQDGAPGTTDYLELTNKPTSMPPSGPAGGVLDGDYPDPGFAVPMADMGHIQAEQTARAAALLALKAEILGGAGPAFDTLLEFQNLWGTLDAEHDTDIANLLTQIGLKADADDLVQEGVDRVAGDAALDLDIAAEAAARISGDAALGIEIDDLEAADVVHDTAIAALQQQDQEDGREFYSFRRDDRRLTVSTDTAQVNVDSGADGAYTRAYARGTSTTIPDSWPALQGYNTQISTGGYLYALAPTYLGLQEYEFNCDWDRFAFAVSAVAGYGVQIVVDGAPLSASPFVFPATGGRFPTVVFDSGKKIRHIKLITDVPISNLYTVKPGKIWRPGARTGPLVGVIGDSFTAPMVFENSAANVVSLLSKHYGMYQSMAPLLGVDEILVDGYGGSGYLQGGGGNGNYRDRLDGYSTYQGIIQFPLDLLAFHGGGANDLNSGHTVSAIVAQVIATFQDARAFLPNTKLVFIEGFTTPLGGYSTFADEYLDILNQLMASAAMDAVGVYYIPTTSHPRGPFINGAGYTANVNADNENANIYVGYDGVHYTIDGGSFLRSQMAPMFRRILRDRGALLNQLVV